MLSISRPKQAERVRGDEERDGGGKGYFSHSAYDSDINNACVFLI